MFTGTKKKQQQQHKSRIKGKTNISVFAFSMVFFKLLDNNMYICK